MKAGYNSIYGYYLEVTKSHSAKVPYNYTRKQTLTNASGILPKSLKNWKTKF